MNQILQLIIRLYAGLVRLYPPSFRAEFGEEMQTVFSTAMAEAQRSGKDKFWKLMWRELRGWFGSVLREHLQARRNKITVQDQFMPLKSGELLAAILLFLIPPLSLLLLVFVSSSPKWLGPTMLIIFLGSAIGPLILAFISGLPRWSPPYLGVLLIGFVFYGPFWVVWGWIYPAVVRWFGMMYTWPMSVRIFVQGMQAALIWFLVLLAALILVSLLRLWPHTRALWQRIRQDWTQLSFFLYGGLVFQIILIFDEYQHDEPWMIAAWGCLGLGCWLYLRSREQKQRIIILLCGATLAMWIVAVGKWYLVPLQNWAEWFERYDPGAERWFEFGRTIADWCCLVIALLIPSLLTLLPRSQKTTPEEKPALA